MDIERRCTKCKSFKELEEFARKKDGKDGRASQCKRCCADWQARYRRTPKGKTVTRKYVELHLDTKLDRISRWCQENPDRLKLARVLRAQRKIKIALDRAVTPEERSRYEHKISRMDQRIKILQDQIGEHTCDQVHGRRTQGQDLLSGPGPIKHQ